ncbi:hypothetical protein ACJJTC_008423 [Scirpophaga incertulas]
MSCNSGPMGTVPILGTVPMAGNITSLDRQTNPLTEKPTPKADEITVMHNALGFKLACSIIIKLFLKIQPRHTLFAMLVWSYGYWNKEKVRVAEFGKGVFRVAWPSSSEPGTDRGNEIRTK